MFYVYFLVKYRILEMLTTDKCILPSYLVMLSCPITIPKDFLNNAHSAILSLCPWMTGR